MKNEVAVVMGVGVGLGAASSGSGRAAWASSATLGKAWSGYNNGALSQKCVQMPAAYPRAMAQVHLRWEKNV